MISDVWEDLLRVCELGISLSNPSQIHIVLADGVVLDASVEQPKCWSTIYNAQEFGTLSFDRSCGWSAEAFRTDLPCTIESMAMVFLLGV